MERCTLCGKKEVVHYPVVGWFGDTEPYCGFCFHGVSMKDAVESEGCEVCEEKLEELGEI